MAATEFADRQAVQAEVRAIVGALGKWGFTRKTHDDTLQEQLDPADQLWVDAVGHKVAFAKKGLKIRVRAFNARGECVDRDEFHGPGYLVPWVAGTF